MDDGNLFIESSTQHLLSGEVAVEYRTFIWLSMIIFICVFI